MRQWIYSYIYISNNTRIRSYKNPHSEDSEVYLVIHVFNTSLLSIQYIRIIDLEKYIYTYGIYTVATADTRKKNIYKYIYIYIYITILPSWLDYSLYNIVEIYEYLNENYLVLVLVISQELLSIWYCKM